MEWHAAHMAWQWRGQGGATDFKSISLQTITDFPLRLGLQVPFPGEWIPKGNLISVSKEEGTDGDELAADRYPSHIQPSLYWEAGWFQFLSHAHNTAVSSLVCILLILSFHFWSLDFPEWECWYQGLVQFNILSFSLYCLFLAKRVMDPTFPVSPHPLQLPAYFLSTVLCHHPFGKHLLIAKHTKSGPMSQD